MGLPFGAGTQIAAAITNPKRRPPVIWLHGQECTGCTESLLRTSHPSLEHLILDLISLDYHETLNAGAGHQAEAALENSVKENAGKFILVIEGICSNKRRRHLLYDRRSTFYGYRERDRSKSSGSDRHRILCILGRCSIVGPQSYRCHRNARIFKRDHCRFYSRLSTQCIQFPFNGTLFSNIQ